MYWHKHCTQRKKFAPVIQHRETGRTQTKHICYHLCHKFKPKAGEKGAPVSTRAALGHRQAEQGWGALAQAHHCRCPAGWEEQQQEREHWEQSEIRIKPETDGQQEQNRAVTWKGKGWKQTCFKLPLRPLFRMLPAATWTGSPAEITHFKPA